jgi:hypothetical protein
VSYHPIKVRSAHLRTANIESSVETAPLRFVVLGLAAVGERRSRAVVSAGLRVAGVAVWPAARFWGSPLASPIRHRAADAASDLARDGRELSKRTRESGRAAGAEALRRLEAQLAGSELVDRAIDRALTSGAFDRIVTVVINHPATNALVANVLDEPGLDRLITQVMESRLIDELTAQLLVSDEMQLVLEYITRSPELRAALAHQTAGLADDVAVGVRSRTYAADAVAERFARALIRRRRPPQAAQ